MDRLGLRTEASIAVQDSSLGRDTPMGATLATGGALFRTAPNALDFFFLTEEAAIAGWRGWPLHRSKGG